MPKLLSTGDIGMCKEAALSPMDVGWGLEVGELLPVSPTGQWQKIKPKQ